MPVCLSVGDERTVQIECDEHPGQGKKEEKEEETTFCIHFLSQLLPFTFFLNSLYQQWPVPSHLPRRTRRIRVRMFQQKPQRRVLKIQNVIFLDEPASAGAVVLENSPVLHLLLRQFQFGTNSLADFPHLLVSPNNQEERMTETFLISSRMNNANALRSSFVDRRGGVLVPVVFDSHRVVVLIRPDQILMILQLLRQRAFPVNRVLEDFQHP
mmetsp:Transcript_42959/g.84709  ORF Transcript_42959/g.84709 Transcript_42959/m.84709 type:complete len:212 (+) Transcript_42959:154-789(+)